MRIPETLSSLANEFLTSSQHVTDGWNDHQQSLVLDGRDAGNSDGGFDAIEAHGNVAEAADIALGRLVAVLEQDVDNVYLCAFSFDTTDEKAAEGLKSTYDPGPQLLPVPGQPGPPLPTAPPPTSTPIPSPSPGPAPTPPPTPTP
ncbi:MAG TPA: hypothetical protein VGJ41_12455 [Nocardioides sp.]